MQFFDYIISHYGWQGTALAATILVLFAVQLYYYLVVYGRIGRFRNQQRTGIPAAVCINADNGTPWIHLFKRPALQRTDKTRSVHYKIRHTITSSP